MLNKISIILVLILGAALPAGADEVQVNPDSPERYVVQKGDTLWDIAGRFLTEPWRWPEIWKANPQIADPHLIYPGDVIALSTEDGAPVLTVERGDDSGIATVPSSSGRTVKLSPEVRSHPRGDAIPSIPIDAIKQFLSRPLVVTEAEIDGWPYVVSSYDQHLVAGKGSRIYVRGLPEGSSKRYSIYRKGPNYQSGSGRDLGFEALYVGEALVEKFGDPSTLTVTESTREVLDGDRLTPQSSDDVSSDFIPRPPAGAVEGSIISVIDGLSEIGQYQVVVLDVGRNQGIEVGNYLGVFQSGKMVTDRVPASQEQINPFLEYVGSMKSKGELIQLPEEYAAVIMVFRTFDQVAYALVMEARASLSLNDTVRNL